MLDTALGNEATGTTADEIKAGLYFVVTENSNPSHPGSGFLLFLLLLER